MTAQFKFDLELTLLTVGLLALVGSGAAVIVWVKRWRTPEVPPTLPYGIEDYRAMVEQVLLAPEEFERIRAQLEKKAATPPAPPTAPPTQPSA